MAARNAGRHGGPANRPEIGTLDEAMKRRFLLAQFETTPANPDKDLEGKLQDEWPAILRWMIDGCLAWRRDGLKPPAAVVSATNEYFEDQDIFGNWLRQRCDVDPGNNYKRVSTSAMYASWCEFARNTNRDPKSGISFGLAMKRHGFKSKQFKEFNAKGYEGIQLRPLDMSWGDR